MKDLLLVSNGHGEDDIACKIIDVLKVKAPDLALDVWPMVGDGAAYRQRGLTLVGTGNHLPSAGFATLSWRLMAKDLRAGWLGTHGRQIGAARALRSRYRMAVAVGDIVPMVASILARLPFIFVASAKSSYYRSMAFQGFTRLEKRLLAKYSRLTFARDTVSADELRAAGVNVRYAGNPIMDGLETSADLSTLKGGKTVVAVLPGTRADAEDNLMALLDAAACTSHYASDPHALRFVFAVRSGLEAPQLRQKIAESARGWTPLECANDRAESIVLRLGNADGMDALVVTGRFADVLHASTIAIGMAGTANEQAVGLGLPLIAVPSAGPQGRNYVAMKALLFGDAAVTVARDPDIIAATVGLLLGDPARRERMARLGRERMGESGACAAIACEVLAAFASLAA
jgi:uncharacterized protein (TIGR03492 family)